MPVLFFVFYFSVIFNAGFTMPAVFFFYRASTLLVRVGLWPHLKGLTFTADSKHKLVHHVHQTIAIVVDALSPLVGLKFVLYICYIFAWASQLLAAVQLQDVVLYSALCVFYFVQVVASLFGMALLTDSLRKTDRIVASTIPVMMDRNRVEADRLTNLATCIGMQAPAVRISGVPVTSTLAMKVLFYFPAAMVSFLNSHC